RRRHTRFSRDWSSDVCSSDLPLHLEFEPQWKLNSSIKFNTIRLLFLLYLYLQPSNSRFRHEKNISTQRSEAQAQSRLSCPYGYQERPSDHCRSPCKGP